MTFYLGTYVKAREAVFVSIVGVRRDTILALHEERPSLVDVAIDYRVHQPLHE